MRVLVGVICVVAGLASMAFNRPFERFNQAHGATGGRVRSRYNRAVFVVGGLGFVVCGVLFLIGVFTL
jgi:uncharacterized membrane protein YphA (DoxX/SURF4 family)